MNDTLKKILSKVQDGSLSSDEQKILIEFAREELEKLKEEQPEKYLEFQKLVYESLIELKTLSEKK